MDKNMYPDKYWASFRDVIEEKKAIHSLLYGRIFLVLGCLSDM